MKRERYQCPNCSQACTRKWNLKVHIERNHAGKRGTTRPDVSSPSTRVQFTSLKTKGLERNDYLHPRHIHDQNDQISRGIYPSNNLYSSPGFGSKINGSMRYFFMYLSWNSANHQSLYLELYLNR
jgi:hypothetical protein